MFCADIDSAFTSAFKPTFDFGTGDGHFIQDELAGPKWWQALRPERVG
jgi:hypothetical protein